MSHEIDAYLPALVAHLGTLADHRDRRGVRHRLVDGVTISVLAVSSGADTYPLIHTFATSRHDWLKSFLQLPNGTSSQDTFERIFHLLDPVGCQCVFRAWIETFSLAALPLGEREVVAIDGKTSRHSARRGTHPLHTVSVYNVQHGLVLSAAAVPDKTNETTVIPELLQVIAPVGAIITTDALGCQKHIAWSVREVPTCWPSKATIPNWRKMHGGCLRITISRGGRRLTTARPVRWTEIMGAWKGGNTGY